MKIIKRTKTGWYQRLVGIWTPKRKQIDIGEFMSLVIPSLSPIRIKTASFSFHGSEILTTNSRTKRKNMWSRHGFLAVKLWTLPWDPVLGAVTPKMREIKDRIFTLDMLGCFQIDDCGVWISYDFLVVMWWGDPKKVRTALFGGLNLHCVLSCGLRGSQMPTALTEWVNRPGDIHPPPSGRISTKFKKKVPLLPLHSPSSTGLSRPWSFELLK